MTVEIDALAETDPGNWRQHHVEVRRVADLDSADRVRLRRIGASRTSRPSTRTPMSSSSATT
jgi:hypothetical protein